MKKNQVDNENYFESELKMEHIRNVRKQMIDWARQNIPENDGLRYNININEFDILLTLILLKKNFIIL